MNETMKTLKEILDDIDETIDYETEEHLIDDRLLDSFAIISLVAELETEFDISISALDMVPENFNSMKAMAALVDRLSK